MIALNPLKSDTQQLVAVTFLFPAGVSQDVFIITTIAGTGVRFLNTGSLILNIGTTDSHVVMPSMAQPRVGNILHAEIVHLLCLFQIKARSLWVATPRRRDYRGGKSVYKSGARTYD